MDKRKKTSKRYLKRHLNENGEIGFGFDEFWNKLCQRIDGVD